MVVLEYEQSLIFGWDSGASKPARGSRLLRKVTHVRVGIFGFFPREGDFP